MLNINDFSQFYDFDGSNAVDQLLHFEGWLAGQTGEETENLSMNLYNGVRVGGQMRVNPLSFDGQGRPVSPFQAQIEGCQLEAEGESFSIVPEGSNASNPIIERLSMQSVGVHADIDATETGVTITTGTINGYISRQALIDLLDQLKVECMAANRPSYCNDIGLLLNGTTSGTVDGLVAPLLRGFDSRVGNNGMVANSCDPQSCNAVSVCLIF